MADSTPVELAIRAGLPYARRIRVTGGKTYWPEAGSFEVRSNIRTGKTVDTALVADLTPFLSASYDGEDIVVTLSMTGAQTRSLGNGYYDIVLSDRGAEDARALSILSGKVKMSGLVTAAASD